MYARAFVPVLSLAMLAAGCGGAYVKPIAVAAATPGAPISLRDRDPSMTALSSLAYDISIGAHLGQLGVGYGYATSGTTCSMYQPITYKGTAKSNTTMFDPVFRETMDGIGVPVQQALQRFEGEEIKKADLQVAATIKDMTLNICYPQPGYDKNYAIGQAQVTIDWAIFSPIERKIVYSSVTSGRSAANVETRLGENGIVREAFRDALVALAAKADFGDAVARKKAAAGSTAATLSLVQPAASVGTIQDNLASIRQAVVTIRSNVGEGSGFAVGDGSYVMTAAHVVSGTTKVKMIAGEGKTYYGEVMRANQARDVALIRLTEGKLKPVHVSLSLVHEGEDTYAIGSPLGEKFAFSVSRGVISGFPKLEDRAFIQSDVRVLPGSSGGPLIDARGNVIGMTTSGVSIQGAPVGMNFFVPAAELFSALSVSTVKQ